MAQFKTQTQQHQPQTFLTVPQVQTFLGIRSRKTILKYIRSGKLPAYKIGGTRWRIAFKDVEKFLKDQMAAGQETVAPEQWEKVAS